MTCMTQAGSPAYEGDAGVSRSTDFRDECAHGDRVGRVVQPLLGAAAHAVEQYKASLAQHPNPRPRT